MEGESGEREGREREREIPPYNGGQPTKGNSSKIHYMGVTYNFYYHTPSHSHNHTLPNVVGWREFFSAQGYR